MYSRVSYFMVHIIRFFFKRTARDKHALQLFGIKLYNTGGCFPKHFKVVRWRQWRHNHNFWQVSVCAMIVVAPNMALKPVT
jgi:hypothetical protein